MPVSVYLPVLVCGYVCLRTCVCEHPVGAESNTVRQVGGKLFRPQSDCPVVPIGRLLKQQDTVSNVWATHNNTSRKHTAAWCTFCGAYRMKNKSNCALHDTIEFLFQSSWPEVNHQTGTRGSRCNSICQAWVLSESTTLCRLLANSCEHCATSTCKYICLFVLLLWHGLVYAAHDNDGCMYLTLPTSFQFLTGDQV